MAKVWLRPWFWAQHKENHVPLKAETPIKKRKTGFRELLSTHNQRNTCCKLRFVNTLAQNSQAILTRLPGASLVKQSIHETRRAKFCLGWQGQLFSCERSLKDGLGERVTFHFSSYEQAISQEFKCKGKQMKPYKGMQQLAPYPPSHVTRGKKTKKIKGIKEPRLLEFSQLIFWRSSQVPADRLRWKSNAFASSIFRFLFLQCCTIS